MTEAPSFASASAIANPIPAVEPVTSAVLPLSSRSMHLLDAAAGAVYIRMIAALTGFEPTGISMKSAPFFRAALLVDGARDVRNPDHGHVAGGLVQHQRVLLDRA